MANNKSEGKLEKIKDQQAPVDGELKGADPTTSGITSARRVNRRSLARVKRIESRKSVAPEAKLRARAIFRYADGSFFPINSTNGRIKGLGLISATDENSVTNINGSVRALSPGKSKIMSFSLGFTAGRGTSRSRTQTQGKGVKRRKRKPNGGKRYFSTISIPSDATFDDCIAFVNTWKTKPEIIKLGRQQITIAGVKTKQVTPNSATGLTS